MQTLTRLQRQFSEALARQGIENPTLVQALLDAARPERVPSQQQAMVGALADAMRMDAALNGTRLARLAADLLRAGYEPGQVARAYGRGGWWYREDWRGKRGDAPGEQGIRETLRRAVGTAATDSEPQTFRIVE